MSREQLIQTLWGENRGKVILLIVFILLIGAIQLWRGLWVNPQFETSRLALNNSRAELDQIRKQLEDGGGTKVTGLAEDLKYFYQMVPPRSGLASFIGRLYSYAGDAGIDIDQISYNAKPVKQTRLLGYQLSFDVSGSYTQVKKFIHQLENSPSLLMLDKITLAGNRKATDELVTLQMQLQTFFREGE